MNGLVKGGIYKHYRTLNLYKILYFARHHDNLKFWVVYKGLYKSKELGDKPVFIREVEEFCETINGEKRFEKINHN